MDVSDLDRKIKGLPLIPKCDDLFIELGAVKTKDYHCPECKDYHNDSDVEYIVDGASYPIWYNESKGGTLDGNYWDWDEVHCCENCSTKFWFRNGAY